MKSELISVIIPIYNIEDYIERCVNSIIKQSYENIEILLIDDGSTDNSGKLCEKLAKKDLRIKVFHKQNGGLSDARNFGIEKSNGNFITTIDGDDFVKENYINNLYELIINNNADISCTNRIFFYEDCYSDTMEKVKDFNKFQNGKTYTASEYLEKILSSELPHEAWGKLYKKGIFKHEKFTKGLKVFEDLEFIVRVLKNDKLRIACNTSMYDYIYVVRSTSIMREKYNDFWDKELEYYVQLLKNSTYKNYESSISRVLAIMCLRNLDKLLEADCNYLLKVKNIQKCAKYTSSKYFSNKNDKLKFILLKNFPVLLLILLRIKRIVY